MLKYPFRQKSYAVLTIIINLISWILLFYFQHELKNSLPLHAAFHALKNADLFNYLKIF